MQRKHLGLLFFALWAQVSLWDIIMLSVAIAAIFTKFVPNLKYNLQSILYTGSLPYHIIAFTCLVHFTLLFHTDVAVRGCFYLILKRISQRVFYMLLCSKIKGASYNNSNVNDVSKAILYSIVFPVYASQTLCALILHDWYNFIYMLCMRHYHQNDDDDVNNAKHNTEK